MKDPELLEAMYRALRSDIGIVIKCSPSPELVRQRLYAARREADDPALGVLSFVLRAGDENELWIVKTKKGLPDGTETE